MSSDEGHQRLVIHFLSISAFCYCSLWQEKWLSFSVTWLIPNIIVWCAFVFLKSDTLAGFTSVSLKWRKILVCLRNLNDGISVVWIWHPAVSLAVDEVGRYHPTDPREVNLAFEDFRKAGQNGYRSKTVWVLSVTPFEEWDDCRSFPIFRNLGRYERAVEQTSNRGCNNGGG